MKLTRKLLVLAAGLVTGVGVATTSWAYFTSSGTGTASATVGTWKNDTTTALTSSTNPSVVGQSVTYTATVTPSGSGSPTGNMEFFDGGNPISACGGGSGSALTGSSATCLQTYTSVGSHSITAKYLGDANFNPSPLSSATTQIVNQASTSTSLSITGSPVTYDNEHTVVFTSAVSAASGTPTGTVAIKQAGATLCSITLPATTCSSDSTALNASPSAYSITAVYSGDSNFLTSTSTAGSLTVNKATPIISWASPAPITYGTALSTTQLNATANTSGTMVYNPAAGSVLPAGNHQLAVTFNPTDTTNYSSAQAGVATLTVNRATLTVKANDASRTYGAANPAFNATITGFVNGDTASAVSGTAAFTTTATTSSVPGTYPITPTQGALAATNYNFTFTNGTLTVTQGRLHISALTGSSTPQGQQNWRATVAVTVVDSLGNPVSGVTVRGTWDCGPTDSDGKCNATSNNNISNNTASTTWTVSDLQKTNYTYDSTANVLSTIVINKP